MSILDDLKMKEGFLSMAAVSSKEILQAEQDLDLSFSDDYKEYVQQFGEVGYIGHELTGICNDYSLNVVAVTKQIRELSEVPKDWYVIEEAHIDDIVFWQSSDGTIYRTQPGASPIKICDSLVDYINQSA